MAAEEEAKKMKRGIHGPPAAGWDQYDYWFISFIINW